MFWTLIPTEEDPRQSVTLCEHHALEETNAGMELADLGPAFGSMDEAYAVMTALSAIAGYNYGLTSSEDGQCAMCDEEATAQALSESDVA